MKTIRLLISAIMFVLSVDGWCEEFVVDGIKYSINKDSISVTVVPDIPNSYEGELVIPGTVMNNEKSYSVTSIGDFAFFLCSSLTNVIIPSSVTTIGNSAFIGCYGLTSITIPSSVTSIEDTAFSGCFGLTSMIVDKENKVYDSRDNCNAIIESQNDSLVAGCMNTVIPNSVTSIGGAAFFDCRNLLNLTIPNSVKIIGNAAFSGCSSLTNVTIPSSVTSIGESAFSECSGITSMIVDKENKVYDSRDNCNAIIESQSNTLVAGCMNTVVPNSVTSFGDYAFSGNKGLTSITIPSSVTSIGNTAFNSCHNLTNLTIQEGVTSIEDAAFWECIGLTSITIPSSVTSIKKMAFSDCTGLTTIVCLIKNPLTIDSSVFSRVNLSECVLYVPAGCVDAYKAADVWNTFVNIRETDATAIYEVSKGIGTTGATYNLRGQKVYGDSHGIIIRNGKKHILR